MKTEDLAADSTCKKKERLKEERLKKERLKKERFKKERLSWTSMFGTPRTPTMH